MTDNQIMAEVEKAKALGIKEGMMKAFCLVDEKFGDVNHIMVAKDFYWKFVDEQLKGQFTLSNEV